MKKRILILAVLVILSAGLTAGLLYIGVLHINNPSRTKYPIRGVDVSHYQGEIDWSRLAGEDISFAYIKATEGSGHKDEMFDRNWTFWQYSNRHVLKGYSGAERYIDMNVFCAGEKEFYEYK